MVRVLGRPSAVAAVLVLAAAASARGAPGSSEKEARAAAEDAEARWVALVDKKKIAEARKLCEPWVASKNPWLAAEGHKCLANVELDGSGGVQIYGDKSGGFMGSGYLGPGVKFALEHLDKAMALSPDDLSIHQGRLHVLFASNRLDAMVPALEDSLVRYHGPDALDAWLAYAGDLDEAHASDVGLRFMRVLVARYPEDHRVVGNLGAFLKATNHDAEALPFLKKAVALAPDDAYDNWNLGLALRDTKDYPAAEVRLRHAVAHAGPDDKDDMTCRLGKFLEEKRGNPPEACKLEKQACPKGEQKACRGRSARH